MFAGVCSYTYWATTSYEFTRGGDRHRGQTVLGIAPTDERSGRKNQAKELQLRKVLHFLCFSEWLDDKVHERCICCMLHVVAYFMCQIFICTSAASLLLLILKYCRSTEYLEKTQGSPVGVNSILSSDGKTVTTVTYICIDYSWIHIQRDQDFNRTKKSTSAALEQWVFVEHLWKSLLYLKQTENVCSISRGIKMCGS